VAFGFQGLFDERIMEQLKKMDDGTRNAKRANLPKFKEGASSWDKFLWRDYQAAGHREKQLTSHISGKHKKNNCSQQTIWPAGFLFWYKKAVVMPKKKVFAARNLKDCLPILPLKRRKVKKKIKDFESRQFYASLNIARLLQKEKAEIKRQTESMNETLGSNEAPEERTELGKRTVTSVQEAGANAAAPPGA